MHIMQKDKEPELRPSCKESRADLEEQMIKEPESKFIKIRCPKRKNEQIAFGKSASFIKCLVCERSLADPTGGKMKIKARILGVLD